MPPHTSWPKILLLAPLLLVLLALHSPAAGEQEPAAPIDPAVLERLDHAPQASFWVVLKGQADLSSATSIDDWNLRGRWVVDRLRQTADLGQASLRRTLEEAGAESTPFWIVNALLVTGDRQLLTQMSRHPDVSRILATRTFEVPEPLPGIEEITVDGLEWNITDIGADAAWTTFGTTGEGIVIANIDTGVQHDHPALAAQYRGRTPTGLVHDYNWFDPSAICPPGEPCDNNGHGTHTMGTMVGDDGGVNRIGVAPGARWIAAKGCEFSTCSDAALLSSAQWILAPTRLDGSDPNSDLRPHVVNNSWGGGSGDPWFMGAVDAWVAAGIFPQFSNGNSGPSCSTAGSPGDYPQSYSSGAYGISLAIASFSSRGPSGIDPGEVKPNLSAPGVDIRSSLPGGAYGAKSGTSMAAPQVAGTVALMWSAAPALLGDIDATRTFLDQSAVDTTDLSCGGAIGDNNVWGEGRLHALGAVDLSPTGPTGTLTGTVSGDTGPIAGATVRATGVTTRTVFTDSDGSYSLLLPVGDSEVNAEAFGFEPSAVITTTVTEGGTTHLDFTLVRAASGNISGTVVSTIGEAVTNATVTLLGTPIASATTDAAGDFRFTEVPVGTYVLLVDGGRCVLSGAHSVIVAEGSTSEPDIVLTVRSDTFGYGCRLAQPIPIDGPAPLPTLIGDDTQIEVPLPQAFIFYGTGYDTAWMSTNGFVSFEAFSQSSFFSYPFPNIYLPETAIYTFWDNLVIDTENGASAFTATSGDGFVLGWNDVSFYGDPTRRIDAELVLFPSGEIVTQYHRLDQDARELGGSAGFGLEGPYASGEPLLGFQYSFREPVLAHPDFAIRYALLPFGEVAGTVTDANDGLPVAGVTVQAFDINAAEARTSTSDTQGVYRLPLPAGTYTLRATASNYEAAEVPGVEVFDQATANGDLVLATGLPVLNALSLGFSLDGGDTEQQPLILENGGTAPLSWMVSETSGGRLVDVGWLEATPATGDPLVPDHSVVLTVTADADGVLPGTYQVELVLATNSGRQPRIEIPVTLTVGSPGEAVLVNCGGGAYVDNSGGSWSTDHPYNPGTGWGYTDNRAKSRSVGDDFELTDDDPLYQAYIRRPGDYWFDLPDGTYLVELHFAEVEGQVVVGDRVFDVILEGQTVFEDFDILEEAGETFIPVVRLIEALEVNDGRLEIEFVAGKRSQPPVVSAIRVVQLEP